jgi:hypothetical protein
MHTLYIESGHVLLDVGNDRPNVAFAVRAMQYAANTYADLDFIILLSVKDASSVKSTWIFCDDISTWTQKEGQDERLPKEKKAYAEAHGLLRGRLGGGSDNILELDRRAGDTIWPTMDHEAEDEGLHAFLQTGSCRRQLAREVYNNKTTSKYGTRLGVHLLA